jgi:uncharacterized protein YkwD
MKIVLPALFFFGLLATSSGEKSKTVNINGTTFLADPNLLSEKPRKVTPKKTPPKKPQAKKSDSGKSQATAPKSKTDWPPPHTKGSIRNPSYNPALNQRGCPSSLKPVGNQRVFEMRDTFDLVEKLFQTHSRWGAFRWISSSNTTGLFRTPDNTPVWVTRLKGLPDERTYGELHVVATDHPVYGPAGTIILDTLPDSPHWKVPAPAPEVPKEAPSPSDSEQVLPETAVSIGDGFPAIGNTHPPNGTENVPSTNPAFEREVFSLVNRERKKRNLPALDWNENLARAARYHAADMALNGYFSHDSLSVSVGSSKPTHRRIASCQERLKLFDPKGSGENIACGQPDPKGVMECWMNSKGHRENILRKRYKAIGVGYFGGHWVQNFGL